MGKAKKAKNRSGTPDPVKLRGTSPRNLQSFKKMCGGPPHLAPQDLLCGGFSRRVPRHALREAPRTEAAMQPTRVARCVAIRYAFSLPNFFGLPRGNQT